MKVLMPFWNMNLFHRYSPQIEAIAEKCEEFTIIYLESDAIVDMYSDKIKFKKVSLADYPSYFKWIFGISDMWHEIKDIDVDVYYTLSGLWMQLAVWHFSDKSEKPYIIRLRGDDLATRKNTKQGWLKRQFFELINKNTFRNADCIIPIAYKMVKVAERYGVNSDNISKIIYNGIDVKLFRNSNFVHSPFIVGYAGRISIEKGSRFLNKLIEYMINFEDIIFYVVGEIQSNLEVRDNVIYGGTLDYEDMYKFYDDCDIIILPSLNEGFPNTILEAYLSGKPIVASKEAFPEDIKLFGYIEDLVYVKWVKAILKLMADEELQYIGEKAERYVKDNFSWKKYGKEMIKVFKKIKKG